MFSNGIPCVLLVLIGITLVLAKELEQHSFKPPFTVVDYGGSRMVSRSFGNYGVAVVNKNFARLTTDRQSKRGALYSESPLGVNEITAHLEFRISGQGKQFFGDGLALWITHNTLFTDFGPFHGFSEVFQGIGIIVDTFRNTEFAHKDITVVVNDGTKGREQLLESMKGCDADVRFHEKRDDFDPEQTSRLRISIDSELMMILEYDERSSGDWKPCVHLSLADKNLPPDWLRDSHVGITATTGQLADNHDVISLQLTDVANDAYPEGSVLKPVHTMPEIDPEDLQGRIGNLEHLVTLLLGKFATLDNQLDHQFAGVEDHIMVAAKKIQGHEEKLEQRIEALEEELMGVVQGQLEARVDYLEMKVKNLIDASLGKVEDSIHSKISKTVMDDVTQASGGWRMPFIILVLILVGAAFAFFQWYQKLKKMHIL